MTAPSEMSAEARSRSTWETWLRMTTGSDDLVMKLAAHMDAHAAAAVSAATAAHEREMESLRGMWRNDTRELVSLRADLAAARAERDEARDEACRLRKGERVWSNLRSGDRDALARADAEIARLKADLAVAYKVNEMLRDMPPAPTPAERDVLDAGLAYLKQYDSPHPDWEQRKVLIDKLRALGALRAAEGGGEEQRAVDAALEKWPFIWNGVGKPTTECSREEVLRSLFRAGLLSATRQGG